MEIGQQQVDGAEPVARRDENRRLAGKRMQLCRPRPPRFRAAAARSCRPRRCARLCARTALSASAVAAETLPHSACISWPAVSSAFTGRNVPAPTCSVTLCRPTPRACSRASSASVKCRPAVGAATAPSSRAKMRLVVGAVALVGRAARGDIGRQRHLAALGDGLVEHRAWKENERVTSPSLIFL